jgi:nicotinate-nucleotide adenylyltransferase
VTTGLLGGTFDPPHNGHLALARAAIERFGLERLVVVVTGDPPHKPVQTDAETRFRLAEAAFADLPGVELSRYELERAGPSYTVDTARWAEGEWGDVVFLVGADEFADFLSWKEPERVLSLARLGVATRPGVDRTKLDAVLARLAQPDRVTLFDLEPHAVSSTQIRRRVAAGASIEGLVPAEVGREIDRLGLYADGARTEAGGMLGTNPSERTSPT